MEVTAKLKYLRIAPRKTRAVADLIRGKKAVQAKSLLSFAVKGGANPILKLLNSAVSSAVNNLQAEESNLYISKIFVDEGPRLKRWHPMSRGRAYPIMKRTSHITIVLSEINPKAKEPAIKETKKVVKKEVKAKRTAKKTK